MCQEQPPLPSHPRWVKWAYLKTFLEGESLTVARPKNKGGNVEFEKDIPVIGSCPAPVQLFMRCGPGWSLHQSETAQMESRIKYLSVTQSLPQDGVIECAACVKCAAALYLQGEPANVGGAPANAARARSRSRG